MQAVSLCKRASTVSTIIDWVKSVGIL